jgi:hypothetical protein
MRIIALGGLFTWVAATALLSGCSAPSSLEGGPTAATEQSMSGYQATEHHRMRCCRRAGRGNSN